MNGEQILAALTSAVVVGPADKLVLVFDRLTLAEADAIRASLPPNGFADRVLIVSGPVELAVLRGEA